MKRVFIDTNFILDLLVRDGILQANAIKVMERVQEGDMTVCVSFLSLANFAYITRKQKQEELFENLQRCCRLFNVLPNDSVQLLKAMALSPKDLEDAIQYMTALDGGCDCIISRNGQDFQFSRIPVMTPSDFLNKTSDKK